MLLSYQAGRMVFAPAQSSGGNSPGKMQSWRVLGGSRLLGLSVRVLKFSKVDCVWVEGEGNLGEFLHWNPFARLSHCVAKVHSGLK